MFAIGTDDPELPLFRRKVDDDWLDVSAAEFRDEVLALARGLIARGIAPGDRIAVMSRTRYEWTLFDYAAWTIGALVVPIYPTSSIEQVEQVLTDSGAVACVTESLSETTMVRPTITDPDRVWELSGGAVSCLVAAGADVPDDEVHRRRAAVSPDDPATIIYTSGTTGRPKGCVLTHANFAAEADNASKLLYPMFQSVSRLPASTLLFLPLAHSFGRMVQVACVRAGVTLGHAPSLRPADLLPDLTSFRPTFLLAVPYFFEKVFNTARATAAARGRADVFDRAQRVAIRYAELWEAQAFATPDDRLVLRPRVGWRLRLAHTIFDLLVYRRIRAAMGGRVRYAISGGSPLGRELALFFAGAGILIFEGYGMTETTAAVTVNPPHRTRFGTVGRPLPGTSVRIADDGEILVRGGQVFRGYFGGGPAGIFQDGWLRTGDLGSLDEDGYLSVTGRAKDIIVTSGGKNVAPAVLEDVVRGHGLVSQCVVVGDNRPYVSALITLDRSAVPSDMSETEVTAEVQQAVDRANARVSRAESIRRFRILDEDFTEENGLLTPSAKPIRRKILEEYEEEVEGLYG